MKYRTIKNVKILRPADQSDTGGRSSASDSAILLIACEEGDAGDVDEKDLYIHVCGAACYLLTKGGSRFVAKLFGADDRDDVGFGGNFLWSEDKRFQAICGYPIPIHD